MAPDEHAVAVLTGHILKDPGLLLRYHREHGAAAPGRQPADRDRARHRGDRAGTASGLLTVRAQRFTIRQIVLFSSAERNSAPSLPTASPTGPELGPLASVAKVSYLPVGFPLANGANTTR